MARVVVRILLARGKCVQFLREVNVTAIASCVDSSTLFRGNTLGSKSTDQFMKIVGLE